MTMDRATFENSFRVLSPNLTAFARSLARDPDLAQDLVQETAMRAWRARASFRQGTNFKAWLFRILRNCFLTQVRSHRRARTDSWGDDLPEVAVPPQQEMHIHLQDVLRNTQQLAAGQQRTFAQTMIDGCSLDEVAAIDGVAVGTIRSRIMRGRRSLRLLMTDDSSAKEMPDQPAMPDRVVAEPSVASTTMDAVNQKQAELLRHWRERHRRRSSG